MFENLSERLSGVFERLTKQGALSEDDVRTALREVRVALLEADVSLPVARDFVKAVQEKAPRPRNQRHSATARRHPAPPERAKARQDAPAHGPLPGIRVFRFVNFPRESALFLPIKTVIQNRSPA